MTADLHTFSPRVTPGIKTRRALHQRSPLRPDSGDSGRAIGRAGPASPPQSNAAAISSMSGERHADATATSLAATLGGANPPVLPDDDWQDNLRAPKGILLGIVIGSLIWAPIVWNLWPAR